MARTVAFAAVAALMLTGASAQINCKDITTISFTYRKDLAAGASCTQDLSGATKQTYDNCVEGSSCRPTGTDPNVRTCTALSPKAGTACTANGNECQGATDGASNCVNDVCRISSSAGGKCSVAADCGSCGMSGTNGDVANCACTDGICVGVKAAGDVCDNGNQCPVGTNCFKAAADAELKCNAWVADGAYCFQNGLSACKVGSMCAATDYATDPSAATCQKRGSVANGVQVTQGSGSHPLCSSGYTDADGKCADPNTVRTGDMYIANGAECQGAAAGDGNKMCKDVNAWCVCEGNGVGKCKAAPAGWAADNQKKRDDLMQCIRDNCPANSNSRIQEGNCVDKKCGALARYNECPETAGVLAMLNGGTPDWAIAEEAVGGSCSSAAGIAAGAVTAVIALAAAAIVA